MFKFATAFILFNVCHIFSYRSFSVNRFCGNVHLYAVGGANSYQQLREQAARIKSGQVVVNSPSQSVATIEQSDDSNDNDNGLPFSDAVYDHFKYVIAKITNRVKSGFPLTLDEINKFESSVNAIITDAKGKAGLPISKPSSNTIPSKATSSSNAPVLKKKQTSNTEFSALEGLSSTWEVKGMDDMTTEEYYAALNKRSIDINNERKKKMGPNYDRNPGDDYIASLSGGRK